MNVAALKGLAEKYRWWLLGAVTLGIIYWEQAGQIDDVVSDAIDGTANSMGTSINARLTGYWPYKSGLSSVERLMEGGTTDRQGKPLYTLQMFQAGSADYVSVAGDYTIFPYGQRISIDAWPNVVFRVVDTGGHFFGAKKVYRIAGYEPLDICVDYGTTVPTTGFVTVVDGDNFADGKSVRYSGLQGQTPDKSGSDNA